MESAKNLRFVETILKQIHAGVLAIDENSIVIAFNNAAERLLGLKAQDIVGKKAQEAFPKNLATSFWQPLEEHLQSFRPLRLSLDLEKTGLGLTLLVDISPIFDDDYHKMGTVILFEDGRIPVTLQKAVAWREVAQRIAHEIKNPLTPIRLNAERLLRRFGYRFKAEEQEIFRSCLEMIIHQVDSLKDLVNEFSKFSRFPTIRLRFASIHEVISQVVQLFSLSYQDIHFIYEENPTVPLFYFDPEQMKRVFVNILSNSIASMVLGRDGVVLLLLNFSEDRNMVFVEISDNGCGIPSSLRNRVFDPYFSTKDGGTGLGLPIVHQIISDHKGYLRLLANEPYGTKVVIELSINELIQESQCG
jgi:two-component system nitrogen regulation sensor histidine kinase NtrY